SSVAISRRVQIQGFGTMVRQAGRTLRNGSLTGIWRPIDGHSARLTLTGIQLPPYQTVPYLYRASQGLATHVIQGLVPEVQVPTRHASRFTTTAAWRWDHRFGAITVSGTGARFSRFPIARYDLVFVEEQDRFMKNLAYFVSETHVVSDGSGRVARLAVDLEARPLRDVMVRMNYARTRASS